jgi:hypothetical protein
MSRKPYTLLEYVRKFGGKKVGMLTGFLDMPLRSVSIGWSLCHPKDTFDSQVGAEECLKNQGKPVPPSLYNLARHFRVSCMYHFNDYVDTIQQVIVAPVRKMPKKNKKPSEPVINKGHRIGCEVRTLEGKTVGCACRKLAAAGVRYSPKGMP